MTPKPSRIATVTNSYGPSVQRLQAAAKQRDIIFDVLNFSSISLTNFASSSFAHSLLTYDLIYYRTGMRDSTLQLLTDFCNKHNLPLINGEGSSPNTHRKIQQAILCAKHDIPHPKTHVINDASYDELAANLGSRFVCKPDVGSKGKHICLVESAAELATVKTLSTATNKFIAQELISNAAEYRVYTLGCEGVASYKKVPSANDFRANLHVGAGMQETEPDLVNPLNEYAGHVARCFKADITGVDVLVQDNKFYMLELNFQPGWEQLKELSNVSFTQKTLDYIVSHINKVS